MVIQTFFSIVYKSTVGEGARCGRSKLNENQKIAITLQYIYSKPIQKTNEKQKRKYQIGGKKTAKIQIKRNKTKIKIALLSIRSPTI